MIKIQLKTVFGEVFFEYEKEENTVKETVAELLKQKNGECINNADLSNYDLSEVDFYNSSFDNSRFDNSRFDNSSFDNSRFDNSSFDNSRFDNSSFDNSSFYNSRFYNSRFDNSRFDNSSFYNSRFYNSRFDNSSFDNSRFDNSSFYNSRFDNSRFDNSRFDNSRFDNSSFDDKTIINILEAKQEHMFDIYKHDIWSILLKSQSEIEGLKGSLKKGQVDGSVYEGDCCCLVGTIAKIKGCYYRDLPNIKPDSYRPAELWFRLIGEGMTPDNSEACKLTLKWIEEFQSYIKQDISPSIPTDNKETDYSGH